MEEVWKDVVGYEGHYQVSNLGRCRSLDRCINHPISKNGKKMLNGRILSLYKCGSGYLMASFSLDGKRKFEMVHRVVAKAFLPNPDNLPEINHIDEDKTNNCVDNLEWCTCSMNIKHAYDTGLRGPIDHPLKKAVLQIYKGNNVLNKFPSINDAERKTGIRHIHEVISGAKYRKTAGGYFWRLAE